MNSAEAGSHGHEFRSAERALRIGQRPFSKSTARPCTSTPTSNPPSGMKRSRSGPSTPAPARSPRTSSSSRCRSKPCRSFCRICRPRRTAKNSRARSTHSEHWPICSVHLWFDREITDLPHAVLLDREIHWMYNKSVLQPWRKTKGSYLELVQSASRAFAALEREQAIDQALSELAEFFPDDKRSEARKGRAHQGSPRHVWRASRNRRAYDHPRLRHGRTAFSPAIGSPPAGLRPWKAPPAPATWPPTPSAPA